MKTLWNAVSFVAVVNLIALLLIVAWLWQSQRLNGERVQKLRTMLAVTIPAEQAEAEEQAKKEAEAKTAEEEATRLRNPPVTSSTQIAALNRLEDQIAQGLRRLQEERRQLSAALDLRERALKDREEKLAADRRLWEESVKDQKLAQEDGQFTKAVKLLEALPAKQAKEKLVILVNEGQMPQAVAYLNAMSTRASGKILKEFKSSEESKLATDLLEELRKLGRTDELNESLSDANTPAAAADASGAGEIKPAG